MLDSRTVFDPLWRATDANGNPISGAKLKFYAAGTTTPLAVYSNSGLSTSLGSTVTCDSAGHPTSDGSTKVAIWTGTASWKLVITDADDVTVATYDNMDGAIATADVGSGAATGDLTIPIEAGAGDYTVLSGDAGTLLNRSQDFVIQTVGGQTISRSGATSAAIALVDGAGGAIDVISLPSAVTVGDGFTVGFKHSVSGESVWLASNGANWISVGGSAPFVAANAPAPLIVTSRITSAPASPAARALYIIDGSPTGTLATLGFADKDIAESDGSSGWIKHTPKTGWLAYSIADAAYYSYSGSAWVQQNGMISTPASFGQFIVSDTKTSGTQGGSPSTAAWTAHTLNTSDTNTITGASLASDTLTLPAGTFDIDFWAYFEQTNSTRLRFKSTTTATVIYAPGIEVSAADSGGTIVRGRGQLVLSASEAFKLEYYVDTASTANSLGRPASIASISEIYAKVVVTDLSGLRGATGATGATGAAGSTGADAGYKYTWSSNTASSDPGSGNVKANNATLASITALYISETDGDGASLAAEIATLDDNTSTIRSKVKVTCSTGYFIFKVTGANTDNGTWDTLTGSVVSSYGTISGAVRVLFMLTGDKGDTGATGATGAAGATGATGATGPNTGYDYAWDTGTTDANPGSGNFRVNNATLGSATFAYISKTDRAGNSQGTNIGTWDDSTNTAHLGTLRVFDVATKTKGFTAEVTSAFTDGTTYWKIPLASVVALSGGAPSASDVLSVVWARTGNVGAAGAGSGDVSGPASSVDSEIALFSSTTGKVIKRATTTGILKGASGVLSAAVSGTDYAPATSGTSILKGNGSGGFSSAASGTDYAPATSGTSILKGNGSGGFSSAASGTDYAPATSGTALLKGNGSGGFSSAASGTDYQAPIGTISGVAKGNGANALTAATAGTDFVKPDTATNFTKHQYFGLATLTDGATISWDVSTGQKAKVTLGGNRTMNAVSNAVEGATYLLWAIQDGTGSRTISWTTSGAGSFDFGTTGAPTLTTTASKADLLAFEAISIGGTLKLRYAGIQKGFA